MQMCFHLKNSPVPLLIFYSVVSSRWMINVIIRAAGREFSRQRAELGHSWITRSKTRNIFTPSPPPPPFPLSPQAWPNSLSPCAAVGCTGKTSKQHSLARRRQRHHFWCPLSKESYRSSAVFSCWSLMKAAHYRRAAASLRFVVRRKRPKDLSMRYDAVQHCRTYTTLWYRLCRK